MTMRAFNRLAALLLAIVAFLGINLATSLTLSLVRLDLTAGQIYTLSPATIDVLKNLDEPITLRFYASPSLAEAAGQYAGYKQHVEALLDVYRRRGHGMITIEIVSPEPYSPEEDRAVGFGLKGVPIDSEGNQAYFGIVATNSTDQIQAIPFLTPEREIFLEYDLTRLIGTLGQPKKPVVGLIDGTGAMHGSGNAKPWVVLEQASTIFTIKPIDPKATTIDPAIAVLLIVHPRHLSTDLQFAIDQFVLGGGHALVFVDPDAESLSGDPQEALARGVTDGGASDLPELFKAWGIDYSPAKIVADWDQAMRVEGENFGRPVMSAFPPYIEVKPPYLTPTDPVTGDLKLVNMVTVGALLQSPGARTAMMPLISSSSHSLLANPQDAEGNANPLTFLDKYKQGDQTYIMAARIIGPAGTAFPNYPAKPGAQYLKESVKPIDVIVVGDVDMLADHTWVDTREVMGQAIAAPFASNGDFVINALENLTGSASLASLRGRGIATRPLTRLDDIQRAADDKYRATEDALSHKLDDARHQIQTLAASGQDQQDAVTQFRAEITQTRAALRDVQHKLRHDIERLEGEIELINIVLVPFGVGLGVMLITYFSRRRQR